ncbi:dTMP kinase [Candidatus Kaiserbacteria bacterium CG10_big_fil_rev_8_21_14_0_10_49_17]|uniref:Thymidylate kinase n=1 Tax=Candidatus Kaiserbacteria bacterium CG10_big_fil_rev_8_21_14_0_10_49_17 TaxID=1974609 RepID=A0A2M6WDQ2_9BACT|nr:MAG: dTMP kinase [Candidatus Kaiserbacteria bacterium CG10_big_fil_rev_8_21_14_0_10_49_17]
MSKGKFVVIDGGDGAGKTTLIKQLEAEFKQRNILFHDTREPGGSRYAEEIRSLILNKAEARNADAETMFALFWAARRDHVVNTISRLCEKGILVVSDRFDSSTYAYQIFGQEEKQLEDLFWVVRNHYLRGCEPDVYIWIDVDPHVGMRRRAFQRDEKKQPF